jgi:hypothetical protein
MHIFYKDSSLQTHLYASPHGTIRDLRTRIHETAQAHMVNTWGHETAVHLSADSILIAAEDNNESSVAFRRQDARDVISAKVTTTAGPPPPTRNRNHSAL